MQSRFWIRLIPLAQLCIAMLTVQSQDAAFNLTQFNDIPYSQFNFVYEDADRILWLGTSAELLRFDGQNSVNVNEIYPEFNLEGPAFRIVESGGYKYVFSRESNCLTGIPKHKGDSLSYYSIPKVQLQDATTQEGVLDVLLGTSRDSIFVFRDKKAIWADKLSYTERNSRILRIGEMLLVLDAEKLSLLDSQGRLLDQFRFLEKPVVYPESSVNLALTHGKVYISHPKITGLLQVETRSGKIQIQSPGPEFEKAVGVVITDIHENLLITWKDKQNSVNRHSFYQNGDLSQERGIELIDRSVRSLYAFDASERIVIGGYFNIAILRMPKPFFKTYLRKQMNPSMVLEDGASMRGICQIGNNLFFAREIKTIYKLDRSTNQLIPIILKDTEGKEINLKCSSDLVYSKKINKLILSGCSDEVDKYLVYLIDPQTGICATFGLDFRIQSLLINPKNEEELIFGYTGQENGLAVLNLITGQSKKIIVPGSNDTYFVRSYLGKYWIGTQAGLLVLDQKFNIDPGFKDLYESIGSNEIYHISQSGDEIYIGTSNKGLFIFDNSNQQIRTINSNQGLRSNAVASAMRDSFGYLWVSTFHGLHVFNQRNELVQVFTVYDGINHDEFNRYSYFNEGGVMYVGSINGMLEVDINQYHQASKESFPKVYIQKKSYQLSNDLVYYNEYFQTTPDEIVFPKNSIDLRIQLSDRLISSYEINYRVKVLGFDKSWRYEDSEGYISLSEIREGRHQLLIQIKNLAGEWVDSGLRTQIVREKVFSETRTFQYSVYAGLLLAIILYIWSLFNQRTKYYKLRETIANDLHDEVGSALTSISMKTRMLGEGVRQEDLQKISEEANDALQLIRDTIWSVDPENDTLEHLLDRCKDFAYRAFESKYAEVRFHYNLDPQQKLQINIRKELYLIFKEAITNALKHAEPTYVEVFIKYQKGRLMMQIENDGVFIGNADESGNNGLNLGLKSMRKRAKAMGGSLEFSNRDDVFEISFEAQVNHLD